MHYTSALLLHLPCFLRLVFAHLCVLIAVSAGVFQVLARAFEAVGVQVDGAGCSLGQELCPNVLHPLCHVLLGHPLQVLHRQPEPAIQIKLTLDNCLISRVSKQPDPEAKECAEFGD